MTEIVRIRRGWIRTEDREACAACLQETGLRDSAAVDGDLSASALYRGLGRRHDRGRHDFARAVDGRRPRVRGGGSGHRPLLPGGRSLPDGREPFVTHFEVVG